MPLCSGQASLRKSCQSMVSTMDKSPLQACDEHREHDCYGAVRGSELNKDPEDLCNQNIETINGADTIGSIHNDRVCEDKWIYGKDVSLRLHLQPRLSLFRPVAVARSPPAGSLLSARITVGSYLGDDRIFRVSDCWHNRARAQMDLEDLWIGYTLFFHKSVPEDLSKSTSR